MAELYTINHNYPNKNFAFTLTPDNMGMAKLVHKHALTGLNNVDEVMAQKASVGHTHENVSELYATSMVESPHEIRMKTSIQGIDQSGILNPQGDTLNVNYVSQEKGKVQWMHNANTESERKLVEMSFDQQYVSDNTMVETINFWE